MTALAILTSIALVAGCCWFAGRVEQLQAESRQHEPDEHAQWLGADAGGSFNHGSISNDV